MDDLRMELRVDRDGDGDVDIAVGDITAGPEIPSSLHVRNHSVDSHTYNADNLKQVWRELTTTGKTAKIGGVLKVHAHASDKVTLQEGSRWDARIWIARWNLAIHSSDWNVTKLRRLDGTNNHENAYEILLETVEDVVVVDDE